MKMQFFSIRDSKAEAYTQPFAAQTRAAAIRGFSDAVNGTTEFAKHPEDYVLFHVGEFDELTGEMSGLKDGAVALGVGSNFVKGA